MYLGNIHELYKHLEMPTTQTEKWMNNKQEVSSIYYVCLVRMDLK
jgi:hypothetical protein